MSDFKKEDVIMIAGAMIHNCIMWDDAMYPYDGYICNWCDDGLKPRSQKKENFKHSLDCPVLVAQDILTNHKE